MTTNTNTVDSSTTVWVCIDCAATLANAEPHPDPVLFDAGCEGVEVTLGMVGDEHWDGCLVFPLGEGGVREFDGSHDCECEQQGFSWSSCDICRSPLGGSRHAVTFFHVDNDEGN